MTTAATAEGQNNYRLHVPVKVPVREFWSATVYSLTTSSFFPHATRLTLGSLDKELRNNGDGTSQWSVRCGYPSEAAAFKAAVDAAHVRSSRWQGLCWASRRCLCEPKFWPPPFRRL